MVLSDSYQFSKFFDLPCFLRGKVYCCCCRPLLNFIWFTLLLLQMYKLSVNETDEGERYIDFVHDVNSKRFKALWLNRDNYSQIIRNFIPNQSKYGKISHKMLGITLFTDRMTLRRLGSQKFIKMTSLKLWHMKYDFGNKVILAKKYKYFDLKFDLFPISLYIALLHKKVNTS